MSTNSNNQVDDLMDENPSKETKLEKFLKGLDERLMLQIEKYLTENEPAPINEGQLKTEKIRLWHDLAIIKKFKQHQLSINKSNKKIIQELCKNLKQSFNFSSATIRQRIQKKLSNVSNQAILNHIKLNADFTFDSKRKLLPITLKTTRILTQDKQQLSLQDHSFHITSQKPSHKFEIIHSSASDSNDVQEVSGTHQWRKNNQRKTIREESVQDDKIEHINNNKKDNVEIENNIFFDLSDHESDDNYTFTRDKDNIILSNKLEQHNKHALQKIKQLYLNQKHQQTSKLPQQPITTQGQNPEGLNPPNQTHEEQHEFRSRQQKNISQNQLIPVHQPTQSQLKHFNTLQQWKLFTTNNKDYSHLKWYPDQDQYLITIMTTSQPETSISQLHVLKKFKTSPSIISRIRFLGFDMPDYFMQHLIDT